MYKHYWTVGLLVSAVVGQLELEYLSDRYAVLLMNNCYEETHLFIDRSAFFLNVYYYYYYVYY